MLTLTTPRADAPVRRGVTLANLPRLDDADRGPFWLDVEAPSDEELAALGTHFGLDAETVEDAGAGEQRPRIDAYDHYLVLVLYGAYGAFAEPDDLGYTPRKLVMICGSDWLLTIHAEPLRTIRTLQDRAEQGASRVLARGVDDLLYRVVDMMVDNYIILSDRFEDKIEALEECVLELHPDRDVLEDALELRRDIVAMRRVAASQRELLQPLTSGRFDYISGDLMQNFEHVEDHLTRVVEFADAQRERLASVRDHYLTTLASRSNEIMKVLTVVAAIMLPLSLIAGIYGMNVPVWPGGDTLASFWAVIGFMAVIAGALLVYFRRKRWI